MLRKYMFLYSLAVIFMCILLLWNFMLLKTPCPKPVKISDIQMLHSLNKIVLETAKKPAPTTHAPTVPVPTMPAKLPTLTLDAQDSFYGFGCEENRYRKRLQMILREWVSLAKRRNISQYFICFGSYLGFVRNGDMVPYDMDMDVCMFRHDYYKLDPEESKRPLNLDDGEIHLLLHRHSPHPLSNTPRKDCKGNIVRSPVDDCAILNPHARLYNGALIYMDIFMFEDLGVKLWDEFRDKMHNRDAILPVEPCKYLELDTKCPNNAEKFLNVYYGKDYMTPHHKCKGGKWQQNMIDARPAFV